METKEYRTRTLFRAVDNHPIDGPVWPIGLDIGYSSTKTFSGNSVSCFPSFAIQDNDSYAVSFGDASIDEGNLLIRYKSETGTTWTVGAVAQNRISVDDTTAGSLDIYDRKRYNDPMFLVLARTGIALGCQTNEYGGPAGKRIIIETGLPPKYMTTDKKLLTNVLKGRHKFSISLAGGPWVDFDFTITDDDIDIIDQPRGTLFSVVMDKNFNFLPNAKDFLKSKILIFDPGFGTLDTVPVIASVIDPDQCQTYDNLGMKQVLANTCKEIARRYNFEIPVPAVQQYLETGQVIQESEDGYSSNYVPFDDILAACSKDICDKAIEKVMGVYNIPKNYKYFVITGGTGAAWSSFIRGNKYFVHSNTVQIISGNNGDPNYGYLMSNARGYYIWAYAKCRKANS